MGGALPKLCVCDEHQKFARFLPAQSANRSGVKMQSYCTALGPHLLQWRTALGPHLPQW